MPPSKCQIYVFGGQGYPNEAFAAAKAGTAQAGHPRGVLTTEPARDQLAGRILHPMRDLFFRKFGLQQAPFLTRQVDPRLLAPIAVAWGLVSVILLLALGMRLRRFAHTWHTAAAAPNDRDRQRMVAEGGLDP
jgi:hypothetical protein